MVQGAYERAGLVADPKASLPDEPPLGPAPVAVERIGAEARRHLDYPGRTEANWALRIDDRALILELGTKAAEGWASELMRGPESRAPASAFNPSVPPPQQPA